MKTHKYSLPDMPQETYPIYNGNPLYFKPHKVKTINEQKLQGEVFVFEDTDFVGCDFDQANVHCSARARFIGCTFIWTTIHALDSKEFHSGVAVYKEHMECIGHNTQIGTGSYTVIKTAIPQNYYQPFYEDDDDDYTGSTHSVVSPLEKVFGRFPKVDYPCDCIKVAKRLDTIIIHLNDDHKWTREKIADWIETLEQDLTVKAGDIGD